MKDKLFPLLVLLMVIAIPANAQTDPQHFVGASWSYFGFNSTYSKNSEKKTFGTFGITYECRFNKWISAIGKDSTENREWWNIKTCNEEKMEWEAIRQRDNGTQFTHTFIMKRVQSE